MLKHRVLMYIILIMLFFNQHLKWIKKKLENVIKYNVYSFGCKCNKKYTS